MPSLVANNAAARQSEKMPAFAPIWSRDRPALPDGAAGPLARGLLSAVRNNSLAGDPLKSQSLDGTERCLRTKRLRSSREERW